MATASPPATADKSPGTGSKVGFTLPWMSTLPSMVTLLSTDTSARTASGSSAVTDTAPSIARGAFPLIVTGPSIAPPMGDLPPHHDRQRRVGANGDTGSKHQLVDLQSALNRDGDGPTQKLGGRDLQNQAGQHNRCRPAIRHQQITAGHRPLGNGLSALQRV